MNLLKHVLYTCLILTFVSCNKDELSPESSFLSIYDDNNYNAVYKPVGLGQSDSSIFILSERKLDVSNFSGINLLINDPDGDFSKEIILEDQYVAPTKSLITIGKVHYFFCMDRNTLRPYLVRISPSGVPTYVSINLSSSYPLAANITNDNQLILLSYNQEYRQSVISLVTLNGDILLQAGYSIEAGNDVLQAIINHFTRENDQLPFFCGQAPNNSYCFNSFYNYTLSTIFSDFGQDPLGVMQGQGVDAALQYLLAVNGNKFAFITYQFEDHFMSADTEFSTTNISSSVNYFDRKVPEIAYNSFTNDY
jgi:hypothetical protein